jgi:leader peptidase (prepilin peptidase)/N-methyltransferase
LIYILTNWCLRSTDQQLGRFSARYLILDLLLMSGAVGAWYLCGVSLQTGAFLFLLANTLVVSLTDFRYHLIPDRLTLPGIGVGLLIALISDHVSMLEAVIGGGVGFVLFCLIAVAGDRVLKKKSMGGGDIKLAAMLGLFLGWQQLLLTVFMAALLALVFILGQTLLTSTSFKARVSFGPFLMYAALPSFALGHMLLDLYLEFAGLSGI